MPISKWSLVPHPSAVRTVTQTSARAKNGPPWTRGMCALYHPPPPDRGMNPLLFGFGITGGRKSYLYTKKWFYKSSHSLTEYTSCIIRQTLQTFPFGVTSKPTTLKSVELVKPLLGIFLFKKIECFNIFVLNPSWILAGFYLSG